MAGMFRKRNSQKLLIQSFSAFDLSGPQAVGELAMNWTVCPCLKRRSKGPIGCGVACNPSANCAQPKL